MRCSYHEPLPWSRCNRMRLRGAKRGPEFSARTHARNFTSGFMSQLVLGSRSTSPACGNGGAEMRCRYYEGRETHRAFISIFRTAAFTLRLVVREFVHREEH